MTTGSVPQDIIERVREASNIVDIIGDYVRLKKRGRNYVALCPFHAEKTPSFSVSPERQVYHCFGCGKGGNVFTFLMEHENMTFMEALRTLAGKAGITIQTDKRDRSAQDQLDRLYYAHQVALEYFRANLYSPRDSGQALGYLKERRKLTDETIDFFQLGLATNDWEGFLSCALKKGLFPPELVKAGLVIRSEKGDKYYDRFRLRLMVPIFNLSGKVIAFGGRALADNETAKYINSPETALYTKSNILYGLNLSRQFIRESNEVVIVEGYFDLISLFQAGIKNVAATSGTAFSSTQARLLARFADTAYLFFDADSAGQEAAARSVHALYDAGMEVLVMVPPQGDDPDSLAIKAGPRGVMKIKSQARSFLEFRTKDIDPEKQGIIDREKLIKELAAIAARIGDLTRRQIFIASAADLLNTSAQTFYDLIASSSVPGKPTFSIRPPKKIADMERDLLSLIVAHPEYIDMVTSEIAVDDFQSEDHRRIYTVILKTSLAGGSITASSLIDKVGDSSLGSTISSMTETAWENVNVKQIIKDYLNKILYFKRERIIDRLKGELKIAEEKGDSETARRLTEEIADLIRRRQV
jgi:DNA primase